jgi:hypothetical protein
MSSTEVRKKVSNIFRTMTLSNKAINRLAKSLAPEVADSIFMSDAWITLCHEVVPDAVTKLIGKVDEDLLFEVSLAIMDRIYFKVD